MTTVQFEHPLIEATLIRRNRFLADVRLRNGDEITVHCAHAGSMIGCSDPGSKVLLSEHNDPRRKLKHQIEIIYAGRTPVGIHTGRPTAVVAEAIVQGKISELAGYATLRKETGVVRGTHVDIALEGNGLRTCYIQVKNVTLAENGVAYFPDAVSATEGERLLELTDLIREGFRAMAIFVAQRSDVTSFRPADHIDPDFGQTFRDAVARGVELLCFRAIVTRKGIQLDEKLPVEQGV
jgi:sugar fermentation stimulation protein A